MIQSPAPIVGDDDPMSSHIAARNFAVSRATMMTRIGQYLLDHVGEWLSKDTLRAVGQGDSADRRVREFRNPPYNWPISARPLHAGSNTWYYRLDHLPEDPE